MEIGRDKQKCRKLGITKGGKIEDMPGRKSKEHKEGEDTVAVKRHEK